MTTPGLTRVYAVHGKLAHLLWPGDTPETGDALCGRPAAHPGWRGTGSQAEYELAASLPLCSRCLYLSEESTDLPVPHRPPGGTGAMPAEPATPSGNAEGAPDGQSPVALGARAGLPPSPVPGGRPAPGPAGEGRIGGASPAAGRTWTVELPPGMPLLSLNHREHWAARNRKARGLKDAAIVLARQAKIPPLERIRVTVLFDPPDRRERDHDNLWPVAKHLTDGLVIAGVVPNDTPEYVAPGHVEVTGTVFPRGRLRMIIADLGGEAA